MPRPLIKPYSRMAFIVAMTLSAAFTVGTLVVLFLGGAYAGKTFNTAAILVTVAGLLQLDVSGIFQKIYDEYSDVERYPWGPPSYITREIIDSPDPTWRDVASNLALKNARTGYWLILAGTIGQAIAVWM